MRTSRALALAWLLGLWPVPAPAQTTPAAPPERAIADQALLKAGARVDPRAKDGWTALEAAAMIGGEEIEALLRAHGAKERPGRC